MSSVVNTTSSQHFSIFCSRVKRLWQAHMTAQYTLLDCAERILQLVSPRSTQTFYLSQKFQESLTSCQQLPDTRRWWTTSRKLSFRYSARSSTTTNPASRHGEGLISSLEFYPQDQPILSSFWGSFDKWCHTSSHYYPNKFTDISRRN